jgi:hypothetical protein
MWVSASAGRRAWPGARLLEAFRFDSEMIVTPYLFRARGYQHTALHLRQLSQHGIFESFADQFEQIWGTVTPYSTTQGFANGLTA